MKNFLKSWKTTFISLLVLAGAMIGLVTKNDELFKWCIAVGLPTIGFFAKDYNSTNSKKEGE